MQKNSYFQDALANFTHEAASGGAIRHLTDLGYTVKQITEQLDFPTPYERVQKAVWERLLDTGVILLQEPGSVSLQANGLSQSGGCLQKKPVYVREYDQYGKASFRLAAEEEERQEESVICWKEHRLETGECGQTKFLQLLGEKVQKNGESRSYMSCGFGLMARKSPGQFQAMLQVLHGRQREYLDGLPWEGQMVYHRLDARMMEILARLYKTEFYQGICYFLETRDKIFI